MFRLCQSQAAFPKAESQRSHCFIGPVSAIGAEYPNKGLRQFGALLRLDEPF